MNRAFLVVAAMAISHVFGDPVLGEEITFHLSGDANQISWDLVHKVISKVRQQGSISIQDNRGIQEGIGRLIEDEVLGLSAAERQTLVKGTIGESDYLDLEQLFMRQLHSSDGAQQRSALRSLGYPLFAEEAVDEIKAFAFHSDRMTQFLAIKSLVYLDVAGANHLLRDMVLSGALMDYEMSTAVDALYISNDESLDALAMALLARNPGGATFKSLLPILKERTDYREIVKHVFKSNMFYIPDEASLPIEQGRKVLAERALLEEMFSDPKFFLADGEVKKKVLMYAGATCRDLPYETLCAMALFTLEKSGQELGYFTEMLKEDQLTPQKRQRLEKVISRIQNGQRLQ